MVIKGSIPEGDITIVNIYAPNIGAPQYIANVKSHKGEIDSNTQFIPMDRSSREKVSKETQTLNDTLDQMN